MTRICVDYEVATRGEITNLYQTSHMSSHQYMTYYNNRWYQIDRYGDEYKLTQLETPENTGLDLTKQKDRILNNMVDWSLMQTGGIADFFK